MSKTVEMIAYDEVMNERLIDKQVEVLKKIEQKLDGIHHARKCMSPMYLKLNSDEEAAALYIRLLDLQRKCLNMEIFRAIPIDELTELDIMLW